MSEIKEQSSTTGHKTVKRSIQQVLPVMYYFNVINISYVFLILLNINVLPCTTMYAHVSPCITMYAHVLSCITMVCP